MAQTLDDFLKVWKEEGESRDKNEALVKDSYAPNIYQYIIKRTREQRGIDPTIGPNGEHVKLTPDEYRALGAAVNGTDRKKAVLYSKTNLNKILDETNDDKLVQIVSSFEVKDNSQSKDLTDKIKQYQIIAQALGLLRTRKEGEVKAAINFMDQNPDTEKYLKESLRNDSEHPIIDEEELDMWAGSLMYVGHSNPAIYQKAYEFKAKKLEAEIKGIGKSQLTRYVNSAIAASENKDQAYETIYRVLSAKE